VALVSQGNGGRFAGIYLNGELAASIQECDGPDVLLQELWIGKLASQYTHKGQIAEFRIWSKVRSQQEIQSHMYRRLTGREQGLAGYWPLDEGPGGQAKDLSHSHHGTINGAAWAENAPHLLPPPLPSSTGQYREAVRSIAERLAQEGHSLGTGYASDPPEELPAKPLSELIAARAMPQYDLYTRLQAAVQDGRLTFDPSLLSTDYAAIVDLAGTLVDIFAPIRNVKVEFAQGEPGMIGAPGMEVKTEPAQDDNLATPEDHAVKVSGDVTLYGLEARLEYADFFHYKGKPHCSFKFLFADSMGLDRFLPDLPLIGGLVLSSPIIIAATASTLYDPGLDSGINEGFNFFGGLQVADSDDEALKFVGGLLRVRELAVHAAVDTSDASPEYVLEGAVQRDITLLDGESFRLRFTRSDVTYAIQGKPPEPSVTLSHDLVVTLREKDQDTHLVFTGGIKLEAESITGMFTMNGTGRSPEGALSGSVQNTGEWREPFGIPGVVIRQMAVQMGLSYLAPWIDNIGVHGNLKIGDVDGSISVLVDVNDPDQFVLAGSTDRITMLELMSAVSPATLAAFQALSSDLKSTLN
jgi:hypothetical protein